MHRCIVKRDCSASGVEPGQGDEGAARRLSPVYIEGLRDLAREAGRPLVQKATASHLALGIDWRAIHPARRTVLNRWIEDAAWSYALEECEEEDLRVGLQRQICAAFAPEVKP